MLSEVQMEAIHITEPHYEIYSVFSFDFWFVFQSSLQGLVILVSSDCYYAIFL